LISSVGFRGRISVILALLKKEMSISDKVRPFFIINSITKSKPWDKRILTDPLPLIALLNAYADKISLEYLIQLLKVAEPIVKKGRYSFANFKAKFARDVLACFLNGRPLPDLPLTDLGYAKFEHLVYRLLVDQLTRMVQKYTVKFVGVKMQLISSYLLGEKVSEFYRKVTDKIVTIDGYKIFPTNPLYSRHCDHPAFSELLRHATNITRRHLMTGLSAWDDEILDTHLGGKSKIQPIFDYIQMKLGQLSPYLIADRLSLPTVLAGLSNSELNKVSSLLKVPPHLMSEKELKKIRDKYRSAVPEDSTSVLKLIDKAYAKSMKDQADAKATLHAYILSRDIQSGFDAGA
jgi:hypothetical protein